MSRKVETVTSATTAEAAWERMQRLHIHHLVVVDEDRVSGILSDADLGGRHGEPVRRGHTVSQLMTPYIVSAKPSMTVRHAARMIGGRSISCLPVLDDGKLLGIITITDLLNYFSDQPEKDSGTFSPISGSNART